MAMSRPDRIVLLALCVGGVYFQWAHISEHTYFSIAWFMRVNRFWPESLLVVPGAMGLLWLLWMAIKWAPRKPGGDCLQ